MALTPAIRTFAVAGCAALACVSAQAGGWAVITLQHVPEVVTARRPVTLVYTIRQHGHTPLSGLSGRLEARKGHRLVRSVAKTLPAGGTYGVTVTFPEPGTWTTSIVGGSGFLGDTLTLDVDVTADGEVSRASMAAQRGRQLFEGKGCVMCHAHPEFGGRRIANVLDMSAKRYTPEYVQAFLTSVAMPGATSRKMPDLGLSAGEIDALAAFLGQPVRD
jgi:hypothetical protein